MSLITLNIRQKLAATAIFSLFVFVGGGYYLYHQYSKGPALFDTVEEPEYITLKPEIIPTVTSFNAKSASKGKVNFITDNIILSDLKARKFAEASDNGVANSSFPNTGLAFKPVRAVSQHSASGGSSTGLLASGGKSGSSSAAFSSGSAGGSSPMSQPAAYVPFAGNGTGGNALIDPGADPKKNEMIPVGEGIWILMLLAAVYGWKKRKKPL